MCRCKEGIDLPLFNLPPEFEIKEGCESANFIAVQGWLTGTYWSPGISMDTVVQGAENSALVLSVFRGDSQVGYLRVVSDTTRFAWICDVYVDESARGLGVARSMVQHALNHSKLNRVTRWLLATRDAHEVYRGVGFSEITEPSRWMQLRPFD